MVAVAGVRGSGGALLVSLALVALAQWGQAMLGLALPRRPPAILVGQRPAAAPRRRPCRTAGPEGVFYPAKTGVPETVVPVGPFCPFVSESLTNLASSSTPEYRQQMEGILNRVDSLAQQDVPDFSGHVSLAAEMRDADAVWRGTLMKMRYSEDFQTAELYHFTDGFLRNLGVKIADVEAFAAWQADALEALGSRRLPPAPPVDPASEKASQIQGVLESFRLGRSQTLQLNVAPKGATAESATVQEELAALEKDHMALVDMGRSYGRFDSAGKELFIDQMDAIADRWDVYLARFRLNGEKGPSYVNKGGFLKRLGLSSSTARALVKEAHERMREDAGRG